MVSRCLKGALEGGEVTVDMGPGRETPAENTSAVSRELITGTLTRARVFRCPSFG